MPPPLPPSSSRDDVLSFLESLDNPPPQVASPAAPAGPPSGGSTAAASRAADSNPSTRGRSVSPSRRNVAAGGASGGLHVTSTDTQAVLDFLDEIGASTSGATAPAAGSAPHDAPETPLPHSEVDVSAAADRVAPQRRASASPTAPRFNTSSPRTSQAVFETFRAQTSAQASSLLAGKPPVKAATTAPGTNASPEGGGWSWGGLLAAGAKVVKSSEEALKKTSEVAFRNVAAESDKVRGYVNADALGKLGGDLRKMTIDSVNSVVNTIAPPIPSGHLRNQHPERLVCYVTPSALLTPGEEWMDACVFRMFHATIEECSPATRRRICYADVDSLPVAAPRENAGIADGHDAGADAAKASLARLIAQQPPSAGPAAKEEVAAGAPATPSRVRELYLAVEAFQFAASGTPAFTAYAVSLSDPSRSLQLLNFSQATPTRLLDRLGETERRDTAVESVEGAVKTMWREWFDDVLKTNAAGELQEQPQPQRQAE